MEEKNGKLPLYVPDVGEADTIELVTWFVVSGDPVRAGQEICELVTDKASFPLESPATGWMEELLIPAGSEVQVGQLLGHILLDGSE